MNVTALRAYMAYVGDLPEDVALCVFAHNAREARRMAYPHLRSMVEAVWTDVRVSWIRSGAVQHADSEKYARGEPHVIDSPDGCRDCKMWFWEPLNTDGLCEGCADERAEAGL